MEGRRLRQEGEKDCGDDIRSLPSRGDCLADRGAIDTTRMVDFEREVQLTMSSTGGKLTAAWVIRSGRTGERDTWALSNGLAGGGWIEVPDLTNCVSREDIGKIVTGVFGLESPGAVANYTGQLWALRGRIMSGDLIVLPLKTTRQIAVGRAVAGYEYIPSGDPDKRHVVRTQWIRQDLPRTAIRQDLLHTLGGASTIFQAKRNDAVWRIQQLAETGFDPGSRASSPTPFGINSDDDLVDSPEQNSDIEQVARDRITAHIMEVFAGHNLSYLVRDLLNAEGFKATASDPGPDGGVDVIAGRGPFGLDSPRVVIQVKSEPTPVGIGVVNQLQGVMNSYGADQALLVAWGGVTKAARQSLSTQQFKVRVWDSEDVVSAVLRNYPALPEDLKADLPLKQVWVLLQPEPS